MAAKRKRADISAENSARVAKVTEAAASYAKDTEVSEKAALGQLKHTISLLNSEFSLVMADLEAKLHKQVTDHADLCRQALSSPLTFCTATAPFPTQSVLVDVGQFNHAVRRLAEESVRVARRQTNVLDLSLVELTRIVCLLDHTSRRATKAVCQRFRSAALGVEMALPMGRWRVSLADLRQRGNGFTAKLGETAFKFSFGDGNVSASRSGPASATAAWNIQVALIQPPTAQHVVAFLRAANWGATRVLGQLPVTDRPHVVALSLHPVLPFERRRTTDDSAKLVQFVITQVDL